MKPRRGRPLKYPIRIFRLDRTTVKWILAHARTFVTDGRHEWPAWSYAHIARRLCARRKVSLTRFAVRRVVMRHDLALAVRRGA